MAPSSPFLPEQRTNHSILPLCISHEIQNSIHHENEGVQSVYVRRRSRAVGEVISPILTLGVCLDGENDGMGDKLG